MEMTNKKEKKEKEPLTTKQKVFLGLRIVGNVFFYSILICLLIFSIMNINAGNGKTDYPHIFGRGFLSVKSDSMTRDEDNKVNWPEEWKKYKIKDFDKGDLVNVKKTSSKSLDVGDVITFYDTSIGALNTHRIVGIDKNKDNKIELIICQGDKVVSESVDNRYYSYERYCADNGKEVVVDENGDYVKNDTYLDWAQKMDMLGKEGKLQYVTTKDVKGLVYSVKPGGGYTLDKMKDNWILIFIFPVLVVLVFEVFLVIRNIMILRGEKTVAALDTRKEEIIAEEKEKMRLELLAEMYGGIDNIPEEMRNPKKANSEEPKQEENKEVIESNEGKSEDSVTEDNKETELAHEEDNNEANAIVEEETKEDLDKPEVESEDVKPQDDNKEE